MALTNLERALGSEKGPAQRRRIARRSFQSLATNVTEFFQFPYLTPQWVERYMSFQGEEHLKGALEQGKGVLMLSGHFGSWDMLSAALALKGYDFAHVSKIPRSEAVARVWLKYRTEAGIKVFSGRGTVKRSLRHLGRNGVLGFVTDQNTRPDDGIFVPFFGRQACTLPSLALLARRTGAPVVPIYSFRSGDRHKVVVEKPLLYEPLPHRDADLFERTRIYTEWTERIVRLHPDQWIWLHDRWKTQPGGEPAR